MRWRPLTLALALTALAVTISRAVVSRDGVGAFEYATSIALVCVLLVGAFHMSRRAAGRP